MTKKITKTILFPALIAILAVGIIHFVDAPDSFEEAAYKGWLFYFNGLGALVAALGIYLGKKTWGWNLGFLISALSMIFYILSRTVGLPYIPAEPDAWLEPLGVAAMICEAIFIGLFIKMSSLKRE